MLTLYDLHELLHVEHKPENGPAAELDVLMPHRSFLYNNDSLPDPDELPLWPVITAHYVLWDAGAIGERHLRDVKEQDMRILPDGVDLSDPEVASRALDFLMGWAAAVQLVLDRGFDIEYLMPSDFSCADVWYLKTPKTAEDFKNHCLVASRLGQYIYCR